MGIIVVHKIYVWIEILNELKKHYHRYCNSAVSVFPLKNLISGAISASHSNKRLPPTRPSSKGFGDFVISIDPGHALTSKDWLHIP